MTMECRVTTVMTMKMSTGIWRGEFNIKLLSFLMNHCLDPKPVDSGFFNNVGNYFTRLHGLYIYMLPHVDKNF